MQTVVKKAYPKAIRIFLGGTFKDQTYHISCPSSMLPMGRVMLHLEHLAVQGLTAGNIFCITFPSVTQPDSFNNQTATNNTVIYTGISPEFHQVPSDGNCGLVILNPMQFLNNDLRVIFTEADSITPVNLAGAITYSMTLVASLIDEN